METTNENKSNQKDNRHRTPSDELYALRQGANGDTQKDQEPLPDDGAGDFGSAARHPGPEGGVGDLYIDDESQTPGTNDDADNIVQNEYAAEQIERNEND